jgi:hypothetical protein
MFSLDIQLETIDQLKTAVRALRKAGVDIDTAQIVERIVGKPRKQRAARGGGGKRRSTKPMESAA